ncbi:MAG TPA: PqqD family protein [Gammaproteobacteria bacterium]|nr:PqqD family protein [Gammaproteobacteria bacterium]HPQ25058.1 PqqD family protein [Gammaproteobacteria bacterium]
MRQYKIPGDLLLQSVKDEAVILDPKSGRYFTLNAVGTRMVQLYRDLADVDAVVATIVAEYAVDDATVRQDLQQLLEDLSANGLAEAVDS